MNKRSLSHRPSFSNKNEPQNFSYQNNIDSKTIENLTKINIDDYAKNKELKNLQNDIKRIKSKVDFDKISKIRLDDLSELSYEDFQNIRKLKNHKNNFQRSNSVSELKNQNDNYKKNFEENLMDKVKDKEKDLEKLENNMNSIQNLVLSLDLKVNNLKNQIDILMTQKFDNNKIENNKMERNNNKSILIGGKEIKTIIGINNNNYDIKKNF